jgi:hypothetical protein
MIFGEGKQEQLKEKKKNISDIIIGFKELVKNLSL